MRGEQHETTGNVRGIVGPVAWLAVAVSVIAAAIILNRVPVEPGGAVLLFGSAGAILAMNTVRLCAGLKEKQRACRHKSHATSP